MPVFRSSSTSSLRATPGRTSSGSYLSRMIKGTTSSSSSKSSRQIVGRSMSSSAAGRRRSRRVRKCVRFSDNVSEHSYPSATSQGVKKPKLWYDMATIETIIQPDVKAMLESESSGERAENVTYRGLETFHPQHAERVKREIRPYIKSVVEKSYSLRKVNDLVEKSYALRGKKKDETLYPRVCSVGGTTEEQLYKFCAQFTGKSHDRALRRAARDAEVVQEIYNQDPMMDEPPTETPAGDSSKEVRSSKKQSGNVRRSSSILGTVQQRTSLTPRSA